MTNTFQECINYLKYGGGLDFNRLRSGPFEGPAIVMPPPLVGDTYCGRYYLVVVTVKFVVKVPTVTEEVTVVPMMIDGVRSISKV